MEKENSPDEDILTNLEKSKDLLDGVWYLQYTSPSVINDIDESEGEDGDGGEKGEETVITSTAKPKFEAKGSVSAAGITVDVSNRVPKQILDFDNGTIFNEVDLDFGQVRVGGPFRVAENISNSKFCFCYYNL